MDIDLTKIVLLVSGLLIAAGVASHGLGWSEFQRIWAHLVERPGAATALRSVLQPTMSSLFALLLALALDGVYQYIADKTFFPVEALLIAILLGWIPYVLLPGPFARIAHRWIERRPGRAVS